MSTPGSYAWVVGALGPARDEVLSGFRARGGDRERWRTPDLSAMCHALTAAEDRLELDASRKAVFLGLRHELRRVRRVLEVSLP